MRLLIECPHESKSTVGARHAREEENKIAGGAGQLERNWRRRGTLKAEWNREWRQQQRPTDAGAGVVEE